MSLLHNLTTNLVPNFFTSLANNITITAATMPLVDALIIGAGPAGLSAALALARQLHTAIVFDSSLFRNARSAHMHTIPTWDHKDPAAFRGATRAEILERYNTISFEDREIAKIEKTTAGDFAATTAERRSQAGGSCLPVVSRIWRLISRDTMTAGVDLCASFALFHLGFTSSLNRTNNPQLPLPLLPRL